MLEATTQTNKTHQEGRREKTCLQSGEDTSNLHLMHPEGAAGRFRTAALTGESTCSDGWENSEEEHVL